MEESHCSEDSLSQHLGPRTESALFPLPQGGFMLQEGAGLPRPAQSGGGDSLWDKIQNDLLLLLSFR